MLRCYPIAATGENWLHETITSIISDLHALLARGDNIVKSQETWRQLVPENLEESKRNKIIALRGVRDRVFAYLAEIEKLMPMELPRILSVMECQNRVSELLRGVEEICSLEAEFPPVHEKVKDLFVFCYGKLTELGVRGRQYRIIFNDLPEKTCPFCGIERVMNPDETAQDQDHYLAKSIYPFAAANMRNLVPMCRVCNRDYKKNRDVIRGDDGNRRLAFDPYDCVSPSVSLLGSKLDAQNNSILPEWQIEFIPGSQQAETWAAVFDIRTRYKRDVLNQNFNRWFGDFAKKCSADRRRKLIDVGLGDEQILERLQFYFEDKTENPSIREGFLEPKIFEFLLAQFQTGNQRVIDLIRDAVLGVQLEDVA
ncbi:hypothetical protein [Teredinibacter turnerae]|uniref:hypothetical protein n=1 Tax=Teredinibacter turnerae TaxID=2426 RepID=UPI0030D08B17